MMLTVRAAIRSRLFAASFVFLVLCMAGLPFLVSGDGTQAGLARVILYYNISIASLLTGVLAVVQSCGSVSQDVSEKLIQLVRAKPVSSMHIWAGKWLGIILMNAVLVAAAGFTTWASVMMRDFSDADVEKEILTARRQLLPESQSIDAEVSHIFHTLREQGRIDESVPEWKVREDLKLAAAADRTTVGAGGVKKWFIDIPRGCRPAEGGSAGSIEMRSRHNAAFRDEKPVLMSWRILAADGTELLTLPAAGCYDGMNSFNLPASLLKDRSRIIIEFRNEETASGRTVVFNESRGMEILVTEGGFGSNLAACMLIVLAGTGLLAAVGLTLGSVFSFPVAVFVSAALVFASFTAHFFKTSSLMTETHHGCADCDSAGEEDKGAGGLIASAFEHVVGPILEQRPAELVSEGILITGESYLKAVLIMLILYPGLMFALGAWGLGRRQLALPEGW